MKQIKLDAHIYLKNGILLKEDFSPLTEDVIKFITSLNNSGIDTLIVSDLSETDSEHDVNLHLLKELNRYAEVPIYGAGHIKRLEDIKKILYIGCRKAVLDVSSEITPEVTKEALERFGSDALAISISLQDEGSIRNFDFSPYSEAFIFGTDIKETELTTFISNLVLPVSLQKKDIVFLSENITDATVVEILSMPSFITAFSEPDFSFRTEHVLELKETLLAAGIQTGHLCSNFHWSDFKVNEDGLLPVVVSDYKTNEVLMLAYMNEEAFDTTLSLGKMTYYSRSRKELWIKGLTSGHYQYVKSLHIDCDGDTILAKVSQIGAACHTGSRSCFYRDIVSPLAEVKNPQSVLEEEYHIIADRKLHPKEGSYTNYLFEKGIDKILKKIGEEASEIIIAAKNPDSEEIKYEIADFLYHCMVMMVEKGIGWEEVIEELSNR